MRQICCFELLMLRNKRGVVLRLEGIAEMVEGVGGAVIVLGRGVNVDPAVQLTQHALPGVADAGRRLLNLGGRVAFLKEQVGQRRA